MGHRDLREFLHALDNQGQLVKFHDEYMPEPDVRGICRAAADIPNSPAIMLDNIKGYKGKKLAVNVHSSWANCAVAYGMPKDTSLIDQFYELSRRWDRYPGEVKWIQNPPCQEVIIKDNINLYEILPLFRINPYDGGFYLSKASVITRDMDAPDDFDKVNIGMYRIQVQGKDTLGMQALAFHDLGIHLRKAEAKGVPLPIAVCLGVSPSISFMASTPLPYDQSEYKFSAALNGQPEEVAQALVSGLPVPAGAEYVLEGYVIPRERFPEGPFGEFPGSYSGVRNQTRIKITAVTHRKDPIMENLYIGKPMTEHDYLVGLSTSITLYRQLKETFPEVAAVNAVNNHGLTIIVSTGCRFGGIAKSIAFRLASTQHGISYAKNIILVDADVDPFDPIQVYTAMSSRIRPDKDVTVIANTPGMPLDPASDPPGMGGKLIIDATTPVAPEKMMREIRMIGNVPQAEAFKALIKQFQNQAAKVL